MNGELVHRGLHRMAGKARRPLGLSHLEPRDSFPPSNASRAFRGMLAVAVAAVALGSFVAAAHGAGAQRGLVIGIDDYAHLDKLHGAVNDARDIRDALAGIGVEDLTVLLDADATRARIMAELRGLLERAEPGDTLVLAYAGHGWQEPERVPGTERDGKDEALLLAGFRTSGSGTRERIVDDELHQWFLDAGEKGVRVVFVADACHSGTLTRAVDPRATRAGGLTYRVTRYTAMTDDELAFDLPEAAADTGGAGEGALSHVSLLAAAQDHEQVPEIVVGGKKRGALSYLFARAVRGDADVDGDGALQRGELWSFVRRNVLMKSDSRQTPNLEPSSRPDEIVLRLAPPSGPGPSPGAGEAFKQSGGAAMSAGDQGGAGTPDLGDAVVRLAVLHTDAATLAAAREALAGVRLVPERGSPDLLWDARDRQVVTRLGDVAAHDVDLEALPGVVEKWKAVFAIRELSARNGLRMRIIDPHDGEAHDGVRRRGDEFTVRVEGLSHPRLTVFSLSGNGEVHYLYPESREDSAALASGGSYELPPFFVTKPYGADHMVAVSAGSALDGLNDALRGLNGQVAAGRAAALLATAKAKAGADGWSSGVQGLYTAPRTGRRGGGRP